MINWTIGTKLAAGAIGALAVAGGATAAVTHFTASNQTAPSISASPAPAPSVNPAKQRRQAAARATGMALVQAEAQVLGLTPQQLNRERRQGTTIHQMADQKGISQSDFQTKVSAAVKPILDGDVQQGTLTADQEQRYLQRLGKSVPNWDQIAKRPAAAAGAQQSPAAQPTAQQ